MAQGNQSGGKSGERSHIVAVELTRKTRICHGDVVENLDAVEYVVEKNGQVEASLITYPLSVVLTQDCDLEQDMTLRRKIEKSQGEEKEILKGNLLLTVLVAPLYNVEHVYDGEHLDGLEIKTNKIEGKGQKRLRDNEIPRYHYIEFPSNVPVVPQVVDFKHFFTLNLLYLAEARRKGFVCRIGELFREDISQRFTSYLSRLALPQIDPDGKRIRTKPAKPKQANAVEN